MNETLGEKIRRLRRAKGLTQEQLAEITGLTRGHIASMEYRKVTKVRADALSKLVKAFPENRTELFKAAGYEVVEEERRVETLEAVTEKLLLTQPVSIPVYMNLPPSQNEAREEPVMHIFRRKELAVGRNLEAYIVRGQHLKLDISDGDIVLVDRDLHGEAGDTVLCLVGEQTILGRLVLEENVLWLIVNKRKIRLEDCLISTKVIEVRKYF